MLHVTANITLQNRKAFYMQKHCIDTCIKPSFYFQQLHMYNVLYMYFNQQYFLVYVEFYNYSRSLNTIYVHVKGNYSVCTVVCTFHLHM